MLKFMFGYQNLNTSSELAQPAFLPMCRADMQALGWQELDVLLISGDAYIDHPACGPALLGRWLLAHGFKVGIVTQPRWTPAEAQQDFLAMGRPRLFAGITAGAMDSMLAHYTAFRKKRSDDSYTPGGQAGARPNRASIIYTSLTRQIFPGLPVILGGIEASLRRASHYDFWSDALRRSLLLDAKADLLVYGMGENTLLQLASLAHSLLNHTAPENLTPALLLAARELAGVAFVGKEADVPKNPEALRLPSHEAIEADPRHLLAATLTMEKQTHQGTHALVQASGNRLVIINRPSPPLTTQELDKLFDLPFARRAHPSYQLPIPALEMLQTSLTSHRGCAGACAFCSLALHQGRQITSRSKASILREAKNLTALLGTGRRRKHGLALSDVGGPTANMWQAFCQIDSHLCTRASCLFPNVCPSFKTKQLEHVTMLREIAQLEGISQVRLASGLRYDLALREPEALKAYVEEFTGGQLKVAPEHSSDSVLELMRKPARGMFERFLIDFLSGCRTANKEQYVVPYLMSAFPGCTDGDMRSLGGWLAAKGWSPRQVQCFIPTPGTLATAMFYSGLNTQGQPIYVARSDAERLRQHHILLGSDPLGLPKWTREHKQRFR